MNKADAQNSSQYMKLVLQKFFNRSGKEYILALKGRDIYDKKRYSSYDNDLINKWCSILIKEDINPRMKRRKAKVVNVIRVRDNLIEGVELKIFQPKLNRTVDQCN